MYTFIHTHIHTYNNIHNIQMIKAHWMVGVMPILCLVILASPNDLTHLMHERVSECHGDKKKELQFISQDCRIYNR